MITLRNGMKSEFSLGDLVYDVKDARHIGEVVELDSGIFATVRWRKNLESTLPVSTLRKTQHEEGEG
jgi:hypothetical protein